MPALRKLKEKEFKVHAPITRTKNCIPVIQVLDGMKTQISDEFGVLVQRGAYKFFVFVPDAMLGEVRWNRVFSRYSKDYDQVSTPTGVVFMFNPITA